MSAAGQLYATTAGVETAFALPLSSSPGSISLAKPVSGPEQVTVPRPLELFVAPGERDFTASIEDFLQFTAAFTGVLEISELNGEGLFAFDGALSCSDRSPALSSWRCRWRRGRNTTWRWSGPRTRGFPSPSKSVFRWRCRAGPAGSPTATIPDSGAQRFQGFALAPLAGLTVELIPTIQTGSSSAAGAEPGVGGPGVPLFQERATPFGGEEGNAVGEGGPGDGKPGGAGERPPGAFWSGLPDATQDVPGADS